MHETSLGAIDPELAKSTDRIFKRLELFWLGHRTVIE